MQHSKRRKTVRLHIGRGNPVGCQCWGKLAEAIRKPRGTCDIPLKFLRPRGPQKAIHGNYEIL